MSTPVVITFASEAELRARNGWDGFPEGLPAVALGRVVEVIDACASLERDDMTVWGDDVEEFEIDPVDGQVRCLALEVDGGDEHSVFEWGRAPARSGLQVTLVGENWERRIRLEGTEDVGLVSSALGG